MADFIHPPTLTRHTNVSYYGDNPHSLAEYLITNGYDAEMPRSRHEYARLWHCGALAVIYNSGTVLAQGDLAPTLTLLNSLCVAEESAVLK